MSADYDSDILVDSVKGETGYSYFDCFINLHTVLEKDFEKWK
jgi:hypothetical protein